MAKHEPLSRRSLHLTIFAAILFAGFCTPVLAQTTSGTLIGQVLDQSGAGLANAKVTITNEHNGNIRATVTDSGGTYTVAFLTPGFYSITAAFPGYTGNSVTGFQIPLNQRTPLRPPKITMTPVQATQPTTQPTPVTNPVPLQQDETAPLVTTTDPTRRGNFAEIEVQSLPIGGASDMRTFDQLALLLPGVSPPPITPGVHGPGIGYGIGTSGEFSVNGLRSRSNNFTIDGSDNNDPDVGVRRQGFLAEIPQSIESINEFEISTLLWDSELGRNFSSQVNAVSRGGGSRLHGQAYSFFTDSHLNARNFFDYTGGPSGSKDPFTRTQSGFVLGGPVGSAPVQFFVSYEHDQVNSSSEEHFSVPALADRRFLGLDEFRVLKPFSKAFSNEFFDTTLGTTPLGRNILSFYPAPNNPGGPFGANTYTQVLPSGGRGDVLSGRITSQFWRRNTFNARYNFTDDDRFIPTVNQAINSTLRAHTRTQDISLILDTEIGPQLYSQARFSFGRTRLSFQNASLSPLTFSASSAEPVTLPDGSTSLIPSTTGQIGELLVEPFSPVGVDVYTFPQDRASNTFQFADSISWSHRRHTIKFGGDVRRIQSNSIQDRNFRPYVVYGDALLTTGTLVNNGAPFSFTPDGTPSVLSGLQLATLGLASSVFQTLSLGPADSEIGLRSTEFNFFINDNWRIRRNFTLDYGVRYEYNTVPHEVNDKIENALKLSGLPQPGHSLLDTPAATAAYNSAIAAYTGFLGGRSSIYDPYYKDIGPHLGFAWDIKSDGKTVVRGGYGIYYDAILGAVVSQSRDVFPNLIPVNVEPGFVGFDVFVLNSPGTLVLGTERSRVPVPLIAPGTLNQLGGSPADAAALIGTLFQQNARGGGLAFTLPTKTLRTPYAQQWHLTLEHQFLDSFLVSIAYVGTKGSRLTRLTTPNLGPNVVPSILLATNFQNFPPGFTSPPIVLGDCTLQPAGKCSSEPNRPQPALGAFEVFEDSASSSYHALQVEARKNYSHGFTFSLAYTYSHAIDDVSDVFPISGAPVLPQDSFNLTLERGNANFDVRHRFAASLVWDMPFYKDRSGMMAAVARNWQLSTIFTASSGQPFTLLLPIDSNFDGNLTDRPETTNGLVFLSGHGAQKVIMPPGTDLNQFVALGQDGAVGRNTVRADGLLDWALALARTIRFSESRALRIRAEFFNLMNRANFGIPVNTLSAPGFGSAINTVTRARTIQFALKYEF